MKEELIRTLGLQHSLIYFYCENPVNMITLRPHNFDHINRMIKLTFVSDVFDISELDHQDLIAIKV